MRQGAGADHFIAHVLTYGTYEDVKVLRTRVTDNQLRHAPPGVFDARMGLVEACSDVRTRPQTLSAT